MPERTLSIRTVNQHQPTNTDNSLIRQAINGNPQVFGLLYQRYMSAIRRYVFFRVNQQLEDAEDIVSQVFLKAWTHLATFDAQRGNFKSWLYRIARNALIDYYRLRRLTTQIESTQIESPENIELDLILKTEAQGIRRSLTVLTREQRLVVLMKFFEGRTTYEIGKMLKKNPTAVRAIQYRALCRLRSELKNSKHYQP